MQPEAVVVNVLRVFRLDRVQFPGRRRLGEEGRREELAEPVQSRLKVLRVDVEVLRWRAEIG